MKRLLWSVLALACLGGGVLLAAFWYLEGKGISPRRLAAYIDQRQQGHNGPVTALGNAMQAVLHLAEHDAPLAPDFSTWTVGTAAAPPFAGAPTRTVASTEALRAAMAQAVPGDIIVLAPGRYRIEGGSLAASQPGTAQAAITVRGGKDSVLEANVTEAIAVSAPYWRFEGLNLRGVCPHNGDCEHGLHIVGGAHHTSIVGNVLSDFNAHIKINGNAAGFPDYGLIEGNRLDNSAVRATESAVTPIDLVAASGWVIRANLIRDFIKAGGDKISYGAYAKGAGAGTLFERNVVWCEDRLQGQAGYRVGLSFGGGGSGAQYCRDRKCIVEQEGGIMRANVVASCTDDGVYLNNAARSVVANNWVIGTNGVSVRYAGSSADFQNNVIEGRVRSREGALLREQGTVEGSTVRDSQGTVQWALAPPRKVP